MLSDSLKGLIVAIVNLPLREGAEPNTPPQGPGLLAARLRQYGASVSLIDLNGYRIVDDEAQRRRLPYGRHLSETEATGLIARYLNRDGEPAIIALSGMITTLRWQARVARICRQLAPEIFLVSGGGLATEIGETLFSWIPELDAIALGEGDEIILTIGQEVKLAREQGGLNWRESLAPRLVYQGISPSCLDDLPFPAWDLLEQDVDGWRLLEDYIRTPVWGGGTTNNSSATPFTMERSLTTVSSRGCPYNCAFCWRGTQGQRRYGNRSAENLIEEARWLHSRYRLDFLGFPDDNFAVDEKRLTILADRFPAEVGLRWGTHTRLDEADNRLALMAKAGCVYIGFGAESASAKVLARMNKGGFTLKRGLVKINGYSFPHTMVAGVRRCRDIGIHGNCTWIMGYPGETLVDLKTSVAFILWQIKEATQGLVSGTPEHDQATASVNQKMFVATAYPGTAMFREPRVQNILSRRFGLSFGQDDQPLPNEALKSYIEELADATKVLTAQDGSPVNYSEMPDDQFLTVRQSLEEGHLDKVLDL